MRKFITTWGIILEVAHNRAARNLRKMFREEREFEGGKVMDVSKDKHAELKLRWVPFSATAEGFAKK